MRTTGCEKGSLFRSPWAMTADMFHFRCQLQRIEDQKEKCRNKKKKKEKATRRKQTTPIFSTEQKTVMTFFLVKIEDLLKNILVRFFLYNKIKAFFFLKREIKTQNIQLLWRGRETCAAADFLFFNFF